MNKPKYQVRAGRVLNIKRTKLYKLSEDDKWVLKDAMRIIKREEKRLEKLIRRL